jgi:hypothetical protein
MDAQAAHTPSIQTGEPPESFTVRLEEVEKAGMVVAWKWR